MRITELLINHETFSYVDELPEFSWTLESEIENTFQKSYRLEIFLNEVKVFDSGIVESEEQNFIVPQFRLEEKCEYQVHLSVSDNHGNSDSKKAKFETGFLFLKTLQAEWIESPFERMEDEMFKEVNPNHPVSFSKAFKIDFEIRKARLYSTAYGIYMPYLNEERISDGEFYPDFTPYDKILNYQVFDVTELLKKENVLSFTVANGWFFAPQTKISVKDKVNNFALLYQLEIKGIHGEKMIVCSDGNEDCIRTNILQSDIFRGQVTDLNYKDDDIRKPLLKKYRVDHLRVQAMPSVKVIETFKPVAYSVSQKNEQILDFGQVICGRIRVHLNENAGKHIKFYQTEVLDENGNYFEVLLNVQCDEIFTDGKETVFEPLFTFHGFRYLKVEGMDSINPDDFEACLLSTPKMNRSSFVTSNELINRLYQNIRYSQKNNMMSIPTDCPQREKAGWTGDMYVYARTALNNENCIPFLNSWIRGLSLDQLENGIVPIISPYTDLYRGLAKKAALENALEVKESKTFSVMEIYTQGNENGVSGWGDAIIEVPYQMYQINGDTKILNKTLPSMKKWCDYLIETAEKKRGSNLEIEIDRYLYNTGFHFGEWLVPNKKYENFNDCKVTAQYIAPFFAEHNIRIFSEILLILGKEEESKNYYDIADRFRNAIIKGIFETGNYDDSFIGFYAIAFMFDLVPEKFKEKFSARMVELVEQSDCTIGTGFLGTPYVLDALEKVGRIDLVKSILLNEKCPSWLYEVTKGATTIWEKWDEVKEDNSKDKTSYDHYAFGAVDDYILRKVVGITAIKPGYKEFMINPIIDLNLDYLKRELVTDYGKITVEMTMDSLRVDVPVNTSCTIVYKGKHYKVGSGSYRYE